MVEADPSWVELVMIGGNLVYGRADWLPELSGDADQGRLEPLIAWGRPMLLDTSYAAAEADEEQPRLSELRAALIAEYPQVGPHLRLSAPPLRALQDQAGAVPTPAARVHYARFFEERPPDVLLARDDKLRFDADELRFEVDELRFDADELRFEVEELRFDGDELRFDGDELRFDGDELRFDGDELRFDGDELRFEVEELRFDGDELRS